jgi:hypothetical protein
VYPGIGSILTRLRGCQVKGLPSGYHLLRAFILLPSDAGNGWLCVKSPFAYVEAELFVESPILPPSRSVLDHNLVLSLIF